jgi:hypothetical protein
VLTPPNNTDHNILMLADLYEDHGLTNLADEVRSEVLGGAPGDQWDYEYGPSGGASIGGLGVGGLGVGVLGLGVGGPGGASGTGVGTSSGTGVGGNNQQEHNQC